MTRRWPSGRPATSASRPSTTTWPSTPSTSATGDASTSSGTATSCRRRGRAVRARWRCSPVSPSVHAAMFAVLAPHSHLVRHRDPFAGSLRYHLGLKTPNADTCRIFVDGQPYTWQRRRGRAVRRDLHPSRREPHRRAAHHPLLRRRAPAARTRRHRDQPIRDPTRHARDRRRRTPTRIASASRTGCSSVSTPCAS